MQLSPKQRRIFARIQRRYNVSVSFLRSNIANIRRFLWYLMKPRAVLRQRALRKRISTDQQPERVVMRHNCMRRVVWNPAQRKRIKARKLNVKQWSRRIVCHLRAVRGVQEHVEEWPNERDSGSTYAILAPEEVSKQLKEQLALLRNGKRAYGVMHLLEQQPFQTHGFAVERGCGGRKKSADEIHQSFDDDPNEKTETATHQCFLEVTPEKQMLTRRTSKDGAKGPRKDTHISKNNAAASEGEAESVASAVAATVDAALAKVRSNGNFLDMLMSKVGVAEAASTPSAEQPQKHSTCDSAFGNALFHQELSSGQATDSGDDEFFGFEETLERLPGMLQTPIVPKRHNATTIQAAENVAFVSESLDEYMRKNLLETADEASTKMVAGGGGSGRKYRESYHDGLVTPGCRPPQLEMPAVPESLQKLRTVAERRQYLQRFAKNHRLAIINNEATIYRELQRKLRHNSTPPKMVSQLQSANAHMPFTRSGWQAASFVATESNRYYYQRLSVDRGAECVRLPGVCGNSEEFFKRPYQSQAPPLFDRCPANCPDALLWRDFKPLKTPGGKAKLNQVPMPSLFKPCPLSKKPFQRPLDDETAALLIAGGSMAVVQMPSVALDVWPQLGRPLHEVAKRYLQHILPHHDITREWAEFSVSTLQGPHTLKQAEEAAANAVPVLDGGRRRRSFTFAIPYLNDRSQILVRRVVDRSEKLDESFELAQLAYRNDHGDGDNKNRGGTLLTDLNFRAHVEGSSDEMLLVCADVVSDLITCVAISCSENSFIKEDPDNIYASGHGAQMSHLNGDVYKEKEKTGLVCVEPLAVNANTADLADRQQEEAVAKSLHKKQNRLLMELRRLNATVIDAAAKAEKAPKPCVRSYCVLGCVCSSLSDDLPLRQHCGKAKCVIDCSCRHGNQQSRIMRLESDGRSITTEDAFMLRRKATARLARMEKEFTSTIVLTENETLLINESQYDKKRRCTKAPKRYEDFADTDDDFSRSLVAKRAPTSALVAIDATTVCGGTTGGDTSSSNACFTDIATELREPVYVSDRVLDKLRHCTVALTRLEDVRNVALWCMVHELYKCFCGGRALDGKPLHIEKDDTTSSAAMARAADDVKLAQNETVVPLSRARYSFEKLEKEAPSSSVESARSGEVERIDRTVQQHEVIDDTTTANIPTNEDSDEEDNDSEDDGDGNSTDGDGDAEFTPPNQVGVEKRLRGRPRRLTATPRKAGARRLSTAEVIRNYFEVAPASCRRCVLIPQTVYLRMNRKRSAEVRQRAAKQETDKTRLLLTEHILRSVYYHKHELERQRQRQQEKRQSAVTISSSLDSGPQTKKQSGTLQEESVVWAEGDDSRHSLVSSSSSSAASRYPAMQAAGRVLCKRRVDTLTTNDILPSTVVKRAKFTAIVAADIVDLTDNAHDSAELNVPQITSCYSVNEQMAVDVNTIPTRTLTAIAAASPTSCSSPSATGGQQQISTSSDISLSEMGYMLGTAGQREYQAIIRNMNNLVSKKMQDIDVALRRESKVIPLPNEEILCMIKWSNFLDAYTDGFVHIWEVQMREYSFFAATVSRLMPLVVGALGVVNIAALGASGQPLPLMGRMLRERCRTPPTRRLAILMQGRGNYWLVRGFLRLDSAQACARPTPQSHPLITKKINELFALLLKQRCKDFKRRAQQQQQQQEQQAMQHQEKAEIQPGQSTAVNRLQEQRHVRLLHNRPIVARATRRSPPFNGNTLAQPLSPGTTPPPPAAVEQASRMTTTTTATYMSQSNATLLRKLSARGYDNMQTNIEFRKVQTGDIDAIHPPELHAADHRWLVLDLHNDFSHIFVPDFRDLVSLDRVHKVMAFARARGKIVKLQFFQNAPYDAFVTPKSSRKIFFGPLKLNMRPPLLVLLQSVDGQMMLREIYQRQHKIAARPQQRTTAFWILQINGQIHFEIELEQGTKALGQVATTFQQQSTNIDEPAAPATMPLLSLPEADIAGGAVNQALPSDQHSSRPQTAEEEDDDCIIVEQVPSMESEKEVKQLANLSGDNHTNAHSIGEALPLQLPPVERINFTIQTQEDTNQLQITPMIQLNSPVAAPLLRNSASGVGIQSQCPVSKLGAVLCSPLATATTVIPSSIKRRRISVRGSADQCGEYASIAASTLKGSATLRNNHVSTIGSTTITKLTEESSCPGNSAASSTATKMCTFASITVMPGMSTAFTAKTAASGGLQLIPPTPANTLVLRPHSNAVLPNSNDNDNNKNVVLQTQGPFSRVDAGAAQVAPIPVRTLTARPIKILKRTAVDIPSCTNAIAIAPATAIATIKTTNTTIVASRNSLGKPTSATLTPVTHSSASLAPPVKLKTLLTLPLPTVPPTQRSSPVTTHISSTTIASEVNGIALLPVPVKPVIRLRSAGQPGMPGAQITIQQPAAVLAATEAAPSKWIHNNNTKPKNTEAVKTTMKQAVARAVTESSSNNNKTNHNKNVGQACAVNITSPTEYGYFCSNVPGFPRFVVRRQLETYLLKVPTVGIVQMITTERVNSYLNRHLAKTQSNLAAKLPAIWRFVSQDKSKARPPSQGIAVRLECSLEPDVANSAGRIGAVGGGTLTSCGKKSVQPKRVATITAAPKGICKLLPAVITTGIGAKPAGVIVGGMQEATQIKTSSATTHTTLATILIED